MASHESALKAHRQSLNNRERNRQFRSRLRNALKTIRAAIDGNDLAGAKTGLKKPTPLLDKMARRGITHRNNNEVPNPRYDHPNVSAVAGPRGIRLQHHQKWQSSVGVF